MAQTSETLSIVVLDANAESSAEFVGVLRDWGYCDINSAADIDRCIALVRDADINIAVVRHVADQTDIGSLVANIRQRSLNQTQVVVVSTQGSVLGAVESMKAGALDYLALPTGTDRLRALLKRTERVTSRAPLQPGVLVVDDDPLQLWSLQRMITDFGNVVFTAHNGTEAIRLLKENDDIIDVVITDMVMPDITGLELLRMIRHTGVTVIILTALGTVETAVSAMSDGAYDYLSKPVDPQRLRAVLERAHLRSERFRPDRITGLIFLSYAREDRDTVQKLRERLAINRFHTWMDSVNLAGGEDWKAEIERVIRHSAFFLACVSPHSVSKRGMVQRELRIALDVWQEHLENDIYLIPVRLAECTPPPMLSRFQWVDYFAPDGWDRLIMGLRKGAARRIERR